jgi:aquaporin Z
MSMANRLSGEFFGTMWLVLGGCGSAVLAATFPNVGMAC